MNIAAATHQKLQLMSAKDGASMVLPGQTPQGGHILSVLLKRSYDIVPHGICKRAEQDQALIPGDIFRNTPMNSAVEFESDFVPYKLYTDVVLIGRAYAPKGKPAQQCTVSLQVGEQIKSILVTGERNARYTAPDTPPIFTDPEPFIDMGLRYERAYGGTDVFSDKRIPYPYPRNPLGSGFAIANKPESVDGLALPNLEDPADLVTPQRLCIGEYQRWTEQPKPAGFGWFPKHWQPRCLLAGILPADRATEQEMRAAYAKLVPADQREAYVNHGLPDMNFLFFNGASTDLSFPYLEGGEEVRCENLSPAGLIDFQLPTDAPKIGLDIGSGTKEPKVVLQTVQIRMEDSQVDMVWRAAVPYPGRDWLPQMRKMVILVY